MQAYSMDLRERALLDSDAGMKAADVAVKYRVSGSWVRLLKRCFRHQLLLLRPYLVLTKPLRLDIQCQRGASVKIGWKYLDD